MEISISQDEERVPVTVFRLHGDLAAEEPLTGRATESYEQGMRNLLLDLADVPFISSAGLRAIHSVYLLLHPDAQNKEVQRGIVAGTYLAPHLKLLNPSKNAAQALRLAGYDMFLETGKNYAAAIASFQV